MNTQNEKAVERFANMIDEAGIEMTAENVLRCIEFAKQAMKSGECSVEAFYKAKEILLMKLECANEWVN